MPIVKNICDPTSKNHALIRDFDLSRTSVGIKFQRIVVSRSLLEIVKVCLKVSKLLKVLIYL